MLFKRDMIKVKDGYELFGVLIGKISAPVIYMMMAFLGAIPIDYLFHNYIQEIFNWGGSPENITIYHISIILGFIQAWVSE